MKEPKIYKINENSDWAQRGPLVKRWHGFWTYIACAVLTIWKPEAVDMALFKELKKQFIE